MTRIIVDLERGEDLALLPQILERLQIPYRQTQPEADLAEALRTIEEGCDMSSYGDPVAHQRRSREERDLTGRGK